MVSQNSILSSRNQPEKNDGVTGRSNAVASSVRSQAFVHGLTAARRADHQEVMVARRRDGDGSSGDVLLIWLSGEPRMVSHGPLQE
jgi:hypothetical protein